MLKSKVFDVCILDEAGQVTLPASLGEHAGPACKFVLLCSA